jgi:hypothetical protein
MKITEKLAACAFLALLTFCLAGAAAEVLCGYTPGDRCRFANNGSFPCDQSDVFPPYGVCKRECPQTDGFYFSSCQTGLTEDRCSQDTLVMTVNHQRRACTAPAVCGPGTWMTWEVKTVTNIFSWDPGYTQCGG